MSKYNTNYLLNFPIKFHDVCTIYQYTIEDIYNKLGMEKYTELLLPFAVSTDLLNLSEEDYEKTENFDLLFWCNNDGYVYNLEDESSKEKDEDDKKKKKKSYLEILFEALSYFCKCKDINVIQNDKGEFEIIIDKNEETLNRYNFDEFSKIILEMNMKEKPKKPQEVKIKPENMDRYKKYMEEKEKHKQKELDIDNIINVVVHGGKSFIPYYEAKKMTMWQLINTYKSILQIDKCNKNFEMYISEKSFEFKNDEIKQWSEVIKL